MSDKTKAVNLYETEIEELIRHHGRNIEESSDDRIDRINYLNKRLKAFKEPETEVQSKSEKAAGWGTGNG